MTMTKSIQLKTELPGPNSRALIARREASMPAGYGKATNLAVKRAHGALVEDVDGNVLLDFAGGIGVLNVGHTPTEVVNAIKQQAEELIHACALIATTEPHVQLAEKLNSIVPIGGAKKAMITNTGAEAVEQAIQISRAATGRPAIIAFEGAYHGRTLLTQTLTSKYALFKKGFGPFVPEVYRAQFPYLYRTAIGTNVKRRAKTGVGVGIIRAILDRGRDARTCCRSHHRTGAGRRWIYSGAARVYAPPARCVHQAWHCADCR